LKISLLQNGLKEKVKLSFFEFYQDFIDKTAAGGRLTSKGKEKALNTSKFLEKRY
jgi:hypothetical protein